jgi:putative redox protein
MICLMRTVTVTWNPTTESFTSSGNAPDHSILINAPHDVEGGPSTGFSPTELLLAGAGACSAWDVISIMRKRRRPLRSLEVRVEGQQEDRPPHAYELVRLHFTVSGEDVDEDELRRVLRLSLDRYCSVIATFRPGTVIEESIEITQLPEATAALPTA